MHAGNRMMAKRSFHACRGIISHEYPLTSRILVPTFFKVDRSSQDPPQSPVSQFSRNQYSYPVLFFLLQSAVRWHLLLDTPVHDYPQDLSSFFSFTIYFLTQKVEQMHYRLVDMVPLSNREHIAPPQEEIAV